MFSWFKRHPESTVALVAAAFPAALESDVRAVMRVIPGATLAPLGEVGPLVLAGQSIRLPYRVYFDEPTSGAMSSLSVVQQMVLSAIYTRNHDGYVREPAALRLSRGREAWTAPFIAQLLTEYVVEIPQSLMDTGALRPGLLEDFAAMNPEFCRLASARIQSYWAAHYRRAYPDFRQYPVYVAAAQTGLWHGSVPRHRRAAR